MKVMAAERAGLVSSSPPMPASRIGALVAAMVAALVAPGAGCHARSAAPSGEGAGAGGAAAPAPSRPPAAPPATPAAPAAPASAASYADEDLVALGATITALGDGQRQICGAGARNCVCLEPLPCEAAGDCITFKDNVDAFRAAVAAKDAKSKRRVDCLRAETGQCGGFRYFAFEGDIERREVRWFDGTGRLVGQRNRADHTEYCGGRTRLRFQGRVPRCSPVARQELLCGKAEQPLANPVDEVLQRRPPAPQP
jgi:hypothetical protein